MMNKLVEFHLKEMVRASKSERDGHPEYAERLRAAGKLRLMVMKPDEITELAKMLTSKEQRYEDVRDQLLNEIEGIKANTQWMRNLFDGD